MIIQAILESFSLIFLYKDLQIYKHPQNEDKILMFKSVQDDIFKKTNNLLLQLNHILGLRYQLINCSKLKFILLHIFTNYFI
jgi:hypothetical protein